MGSLATRSLVLLCEPNSLEKITNHALQESRPCSDNDHNEIDLAGSSDMDGNSVFPELQVATAVCSKRKIRRKRGRNTKPVEARSLKSVLLIDVAKTNSKTDLN